MAAEPAGLDAGVSAEASAAAVQDGGVSTLANETAPEPPPKVQALLDRAAAVLALLEERLDLGIDPQSLFEVSLSDEAALRVEVERLSAVLAQVDGGSSGIGPQEPCTDAEARCTDAGVDGIGARVPLGSAVERGALTPAHPKPGAKQAARPVASAETLVESHSEKPEADAEAPVGQLAPLDPELWTAQLSLDRARLAFLKRSRSNREALLEGHAQRQRESAEAKNKQLLTAAERAAREAGLERQQALEAARQARTEASRFVAEERARLLGVIKEQAEFEAELAKQDLALGAADERTLKLKREVREAAASANALGSSGGNIDELYRRLRQRLRKARSELSDATLQLASGSTRVPTPGESRLTSLPVEVDATTAVKLRRRAEVASERIAEAERGFIARRAAQLYQEVESLNADRLSLLPLLSSSERDAINGFGAAGLDQAAAEVRQVVVVLRYHLVMTLDWVASLTDTRSDRGRAALDATLLAMRAVPPLLVFLWWRRRAERTLSSLKQALAPERPGAAPPRVSESLTSRVLNLVLRVHRPFEWLLLIASVTWVLPPVITGLLEYSLPLTIFTWTLGGALVVLASDFLASEHGASKRRATRIDTAELRLRSLRLVGRVIVALGLVLAITSQLVGKGTIYDWALRLCWVAAIPIGLQLVRWWRQVIFHRLGAKRKQTPLEAWVVAHRTGWQSFVAALLGSVLLAAQGSYRGTRAWVSSFTLTRRVLAYLFRREISKKAESSEHAELAPLDARTYAELGPAMPSETFVPSVADRQIAEVIERIRARGGGVFAIVGERGLGKTTILRRIAAEAPNAPFLECPFGGMASFAPALVRLLGAEDDASLEPTAEAYDAAAPQDVGILIDDAHRLIRPMMGGLRAFDRVLAVARHNSKHLAWVFAFDDIIWRFFERIRGTQPLFDDVIQLKPWHEEAITRLLVARSGSAGVDPSFESLVGELPTDADEIDLQEAHDRTEANYYRLIWDYAGGNPGVALHVWRSLLEVDEHGAHCVKVFRAPRTETLEHLPDPAVFVLRSLLQLERAQPEAISKATGFSQSEVEDALRFGTVRGYFGCDEHGYSVRWSWFRPITRFLQRRHLLFTE